MAALVVREEQNRLAEEATSLRAEVLDLRRTGFERDREMRGLRAKTQKLSEALTEAETKLAELADENETLQKAKALIEQLDDVGAGAAQKAVRNYIERDLSSMRAERRHAEALLRVEAKKWEDTAHHLTLEYEDAVEKHNFHQGELQAAHADRDAARRMTEFTAAKADEAAEQRLAETRARLADAEAATSNLRHQIDIYSEEAAHGADRLRRQEAAARVARAERDELQAALLVTEHSRDAYESTAASELSDLVRRLRTQEVEAVAEGQRLRESLEQQQANMAEERKRIKKEAAKKAAEVQARCAEFEKDAEDAAAKAKDAERSLLAKLSAARSDRNRIEGKLRSQVQALSSECATNTEAAKILDRWGDVTEELGQMRSECDAAEAECSALRQKQAQISRAARSEQDVLRREMKEQASEAKEAFNTELFRERERGNSEAWDRLQSLQLEHAKQLSQLQEARDRDTDRFEQRMHEFQADLERRAKAAEASAAERMEALGRELREESQALRRKGSEVRSLVETRDELLEELSEAQADAQGAIRAHEALLDQLRKEHEAAETQLTQMMLQAQDKQRRLGKLQVEAFVDDGHGVGGSPFEPVVAGSSGAGLFGLSAPAATADAAYNGGGSATLQGAGGATARFGAGIAGSSTPMSLSPPRSPTSTVIMPVPTIDNADLALRALAREQAQRRAQRARDDVLGLIALAARGEDDADDAVALPVDWAGKATRRIADILAALEQTTQAAAEDEEQLMAYHQVEVQLRAQLAQSGLDVRLARSKALSKAERGAQECEEAAGRLQCELDVEREEAVVRRHAADEWEAECRKRALLRAEDAVASEASAAMKAQAEEGAIERVELERRAAENAEMLEAEMVEHRLAFRSELAELRKALQRELASVRDEQGGKARRELRLESQLQRLKEDYQECRSELRSMEEHAHVSSEEHEVVCERMQMDSDAQIRRHREEHRLHRSAVSEQLADFEKHHGVLQAQHQHLADTLLPEVESELSEFRIRWEEAEAALVWEPDRRRIERRNMIQRLRELEQEEAVAADLRQEVEEHLEAQLLRAETGEQAAREQLHNLRNDRIVERQKQGQQLEKLKGRVQALELTESVLERQRDSAQRVRESAERGGSRSEHEMQQLLERARREGRQERGAAEELRRAQAGQLEELQKARTSVRSLEHRLRQAEDRCRELDADRLAAVMAEHTWQNEHRLLEARMASRQETAATAETWGQELSRKLQEVESRALRETQERAREENQQFQRQVSEAGVEADLARRRVFDAQRVAERLRRLVEQECLRLLPMLPAAEAEDLGEALRRAARAGLAAAGAADDGAFGAGSPTAAAAAASAEEAAAAEEVIPHAFQAAAARIHALSHENEVLRASLAQGHQQLHLLQQEQVGLEQALQQARAQPPAPPPQPEPPPEQLEPPGAADMNAQLRGKVAQLQKEAIKMRERAQELRHQLKLAEDERQRLQQQLDRQGSRPPGTRGRSSDTSASPTRAAAASRGSSENRLRPSASAGAMTDRSGRPTVANGELHSVLRHKLKQTQNEKARLEADLADLKLEQTRKFSPLEAEVHRLQTVVWEQEQKAEGEADKASRTVQALERRVRLLEAKLKQKVEQQQQLQAEKAIVEEQLVVAAKQLEALLADESREGDLQHELASLSKQFEQLHGKHREQLAQVAEQSKRLHREEVEAHIGALHASEQELRRQEALQQVELRDAATELAAQSRDLEKVRESHKTQFSAAQQLQEEVRRLNDELERVRLWVPGGREASQRVHQRDLELEVAQQKLNEAEAYAGQLQAESKAQAARLHELHSDCGLFRHEARNAQEEARRAEHAAAALAAVSSAAAGRPHPQQQPPLRPQGEHGGADGYAGYGRRSSPSADASGGGSVCVVTAQDARPEWNPGQPPPPPPPRPAEQSRAPHHGGGVAIGGEAEERHLIEQQQRRAMAAAAAAAASTDSSANLRELERDFGAFARSIGYEGDIAPLWAEARAQAAAIKEREGQRHPAQHNAGHGSTPQTMSSPYDAPPPSHGGGLRPVPIAADVELKKPPPVEFPSYEPRTQERYPTSPPRPSPLDDGPAGDLGPTGGRGGDYDEYGGDCGAYPSSPHYPSSPRERPSAEGWLAAMEGGDDGETSHRAAHRNGPTGDEEVHGVGGGGGGRSSHDVGDRHRPSDAPTSGPALPADAREAFRRAEALCERQRFAEAVPMFQHVLKILGGGGGHEAQAPPEVTAEVWAHLGVAVQSLDRVPEAIDCYRRAVSLDPSLHVCFANLATLHAYLHESERALEYISEAIALDPSNQTYAQIRQHLVDSSPQPSPAPAAEATMSAATDAASAASTAAPPAEGEGRAADDHGWGDEASAATAAEDV